MYVFLNYYFLGFIFCFILVVFLYFKTKRFLYLFWIFSISSLIYVWFVEPNIILTKKFEYNTWFKANFVLVSDLHIWVFKDENYLKRIVKKINNFQDIDWVLIPWDFTLLKDDKTDLDKLFAPLKDIKYPVYATLWNHDTTHPWPDIRDNLIKTLKKYNVIFLQNTSIKLKNKDINILWLWDNWDNADDVSLIKNFKTKDNLIVLAHNPDTIMKYPSNIADFTVSGHTHWWQFRLPFLREKMIPCRYNFVSGYYKINWNSLYVTSWAGEAWMPIRLWVPPEIVKLEFR